MEDTRGVVRLGMPCKYLSLAINVDISKFTVVSCMVKETANEVTTKRLLHAGMVLKLPKSKMYLFTA